MLSTVARATALTAAVMLVPALCATSGAAAAPAATHHRATLTVHATSQHHVIAATTTRPGVARIANTGSQPIFLVRSRHGAGKAALAHDLNADTAGPLIKNFTVADILPSKAITYLRLSRGTYYLADTSRDTFTATSIAALRVAGNKVNATAPKARHVIVNSSGTLTSPATITTSSELGVTNRSTHLQELFLVQVAPKVTSGDLNAFLAKPSFDKLYTVAAGIPDFLAMLSPRGHATSSHHSRTGRYLVLTLALTSHSAEPRITAGHVGLINVK
ncbi:hypothetical protein [uncultured Jatrophihabitans sp.]|uniref:hypothetical protein n=1 Tax=uncultured Jatrophihabitans sp. TaxID=1610747 RepID=UPI0035CB6B4A